MVESEASSLSEDVMLGAVMFGHDSNQIVIDAIIELAEACAKEPRAIAPEAPEVQLVKDKLHEAIREDLQEAYKVADKVARQELVTTAKEKGLALLETEDELNVAGDVLKAMEADIVRGSILDTGKRIDGRDTKTVRPIESEVGVLPERMVPPCSPEEKHKRLSSQLLEQGKTNKSSTPWKGSTVKILCSTITFHHTLLEKLVAWAARGGEKLVTES